MRTRWVELPCFEREEGRLTGYLGISTPLPLLLSLLLSGMVFFENTELYGVRDLCAENLGVHCQGTQFSGKMSSIYGLHMRLRIVGLCYVL